MAACCCAPAGSTWRSDPDVEAGPAADRSARASLVSASGDDSCAAALSEVPATVGLSQLVAARLLHAASEGAGLLLLPACRDTACWLPGAAFLGDVRFATPAGAFLGDGTFLAGAPVFCCFVSCNSGHNWLGNLQSWHTFT